MSDVNLYETVEEKLAYEAGHEDAWNAALDHVLAEAERAWWVREETEEIKGADSVKTIALDDLKRIIEKARK